MANGKKSFVLYADLLKSVDHLTDEELGKLFKHILEYVNDCNPELEDRLLITAWKPIERSLKEDLIKWETQLEQRRQAGKKSAEVRKRNATSVNDRSSSSTDSVTVSVSVNDIPTVEEFIAHAISKKTTLDVEAVRLKYDAWVTNGWKNGNDKPIKNWKSSLNNTIPHLKESASNKQPRNEDLQYQNIMNQVNMYKDDTSKGK